MSKSMRKGKFRPPQIRNHLIDFNEIRNLELPHEDHILCKISFRSDNVGDLGEYPVVTVTEKTISGVHVSPSSAETLVRKRGITNHPSIAYSLSNISAKT